MSRTVALTSYKHTFHDIPNADFGHACITVAPQLNLNLSSQRTLWRLADTIMHRSQTLSRAPSSASPAAEAPLLDGSERVLPASSSDKAVESCARRVTQCCLSSRKNTLASAGSAQAMQGMQGRGSTQSHGMQAGMIGIHSCIAARNQDSVAHTFAQPIIAATGYCRRLLPWSGCGKEPSPG